MNAKVIHPLPLPPPSVKVQLELSELEARQLYDELCGVDESKKGYLSLLQKELGRLKF